jgi:hypothetical protein
MSHADRTIEEKDTGTLTVTMQSNGGELEGVLFSQKGTSIQINVKQAKTIYRMLKIKLHHKDKTEEHE